MRGKSRGERRNFGKNFRKFWFGMGLESVLLGRTRRKEFENIGGEGVKIKRRGLRGKSRGEMIFRKKFLGKWKVLLSRTKKGKV